MVPLTTKHHQNTSADLYSVKSPANYTTLSSHPTKVRILNAHGNRKEKWVDLQNTLEEQERQKEKHRKKRVEASREKVREKIEKYKEEKLKAQITLLEKAKKKQVDEDN